MALECIVAVSAILEFAVHTSFPSGGAAMPVIVTVFACTEVFGEVHVVHVDERVKTAGCY